MKIKIYFLKIRNLINLILLLHTLKINLKNKCYNNALPCNEYKLII